MAFTNPSISAVTNSSISASVVIVVVEVVELEKASACISIFIGGTLLLLFNCSFDESLPSGEIIFPRVAVVAAMSATATIVAATIIGATAATAASGRGAILTSTSTAAGATAGATV